MSEVRRYLVLDGYEPKVPENSWVEPEQVYEGVRASTILPADIPSVRLVNPSDLAITALVPTRFLAELAPDERDG